MMRVFRIVAVGLLALGLWPSSVQVASAAPASQGVNLVINPGFESGASGWSPWWAEIAKPTDGSL